MNDIQIFNNEEFGAVRTTGTPEQPLFCLADVARVLGLKTSKLVQRLSDDVLSKYPISDSLGREQVTNFINERGKQWILYADYKDCGYVTSETYLIKHKDGTEDVRMNTKWTQKGRRFLYEKLKSVGVIPVIERT